jgi:DUF4097 and DUF4098 domain-containing protein YvlB
MRILTLLENGKINSDEAARLLEALTHQDTHGRHKKHRFWNALEGIPDIITSTFEHSVKNSDADMDLSFPQKENIELKGISGDIKVIGASRDTIEIQKDGFTKTREMDKTLKIKALSGDIKILTNNKTNMMIKGISGDIIINGLNGKINIESVSGDITGEDLAGSLYAKIVSGDVNLAYHELDQADIISGSGDITLKLDERIDAEIDIETEHGDIHCDFDLKQEQKSEHTLKGVINKASSMIRIKNKSGDVFIEKLA